MITNSTFAYRTEREVDGTTRHIFEGTTAESDWPLLDEFCSFHRVKGNTYGCGFDGEEAFEDVELWTFDDDVAVLFKLTFGGAA